MRTLSFLSLALASPRLFQGAFPVPSVQSSAALPAQYVPPVSPTYTSASQQFPREAYALAFGALAAVGVKAALAVSGKAPKPRTSPIVMEAPTPSPGYNWGEQGGRKDDQRYMYGEPFAPENMGREFINLPNVRKPLADFVGASEELQLGKYFKGEALEPWDPMELHKLSKVSANNPDVAWLREAELKHGRLAMMAFVGILTTSGGKFWPAPEFADAAAADWPNSLGAIQQTSPGIIAQMIATVGLIEGVSNTNRGRKENGGKSTWWDGLWFGEREGSGVVPGDLGFDPLRLMPKDKKAADLMRLKELKNGRLAMLAVMGIFAQYMNTGSPGII